LYDHITGRLVRKGLTEAVVSAGGVGFRLSIPVSTYEKLPSEGRVLVYTHLAIRENDHRLYGFATEEERDLFRILVSARGIGPAIALAVMSGSSVAEFVRGVVDEDYDALSRIRGIGQKTARRIVADIKEDVEAFSHRLGGVGTADVRVRDAVLALVSLGIPKAVARKGADAALKANPSADVEELVRLVLRDSAG
jgi:Holliday junction DNA helicase RuvA